MNDPKFDSSEKPSLLAIRVTGTSVHTVVEVGVKTGVSVSLESQLLVSVLSVIERVAAERGTSISIRIKHIKETPG